MPPLKDRTGLRYGRLIVLERSFPNNQFNQVMWKCQCDCGNITITSGNNLQNGSTKSCGCLNTDTRRALGQSHRIEQVNVLVNQQYQKILAEQSELVKLDTFIFINVNATVEILLQSEAVI